jgi:fructokinase
MSRPRTPEVLVVGEALIDIVIPLEGKPAEHVGGSPANVAIGLARLSHRTMLATRFGKDTHGERIHALLASEGVHLVEGSDTAPRTSTALAHLDARKVASYEFDLDWQVNPTLVAPAGAHLHTGSIAATLTPGSDAVARIVDSSRDHATVSYDVNARPSLMGNPAAAAAVIEQFIARADVVKASEEDVAWLYGTTPEAAMEKWAAMGPSLVMVTRGPDGVLARCGGKTRAFTTTECPVGDTVGAGDSFMAGVISGLLDAKLLGDLAARKRLRAARLNDVTAAIERALDCASITVSRAGANLPRRDELSVFTHHRSVPSKPDGA